MLTNLFIIASSALLSVTPPAKAETRPHAGYVKPGAAVSLKHDYDGLSAVGAFETITLEIEHSYEEGVLSLELLGPSEIEILWPLSAEQHFLAGPASIESSVKFSAMEPGQFSLSVEMVHESSDGYVSRRVTSIPIAVGSKVNGKTQVEKNKTVEPNKAGLIYLPAREVIE